jgi:CRISPR/Cas system type I-B associated protein Csh2 (Cas7 group RAMP superfamily)
MLKATLKSKENIDIEKFGAVIPYLKKLNVGYRCCAVYPHKGGDTVGVRKGG